MGETEQSAINDWEKGLADWRQGDFALGCGSFLFSGPPDEESAEGVIQEAYFADEEEPVGFVVVSQTCEDCETGFRRSLRCSLPNHFA